MSETREGDDGLPEHMRATLDRFRAGCEVCGVMSWVVMQGGRFHCTQCGNVFDVPLVDDEPTPPEGTTDG